MIKLDAGTQMFKLTLVKKLGRRLYKRGKGGVKGTTVYLWECRCGKEVVASILDVKHGGRRGCLDCIPPKAKRTSASYWGANAKLFGPKYSSEKTNLTKK